jgi:hypothetical protein
MNKDNTISVQKVRQDPVGFLRQINKGKTLTVIYRSKPLATVTSANAAPAAGRSTKDLLRYAELARSSAKIELDRSKSYKELYAEGAAKNHGLSRH